MIVPATLLRSVGCTRRPPHLDFAAVHSTTRLSVAILRPNNAPSIEVALRCSDMVASKRPPERLPLAHISLLAIAFVCLARPACAEYKYFSFEYNITDISPLLKWGIPRLHPLWATNFTNVTSAYSASVYSPWTSFSNYTGPVGWGDSYHSVRPQPGAEPPRLVLITETTGVRVNGSRDPAAEGSATEIEYSVDKLNTDLSPDSVAPAPTNDSLLSLQDLKWGMRTVVMKAMDPARTYTVRGVAIRTQIMSNASSWSQVPVSYESFVVDEKPNPRLRYGGTNTSHWHPENRRTSVNGGPAIVTELVAGNSSTVTIPVPPGTTYLLLNGTVGPDRGDALVKWNPHPPDFPSEGWYFIATCGWSAPALLYAKYLDPDVVYNLTIQTLSSELYNVTNIGLHMLTYYSAWASEESTVAAAETVTATKNNRGKVIGGAIGGVLGVLVLTAILALFWRRRRRQSMAGADSPRDLDHRTSPYMREVDGGSIHSASSSQHLRTLPPSYNPQWSSRLRLDTLSGAAPRGRPALPSAAPLSPGFAGPTGGFFKRLQPQPQPQPKATSAKVTTAALADYKQPYLTGTFEGFNAAPPRDAVDPGSHPEAPAPQAAPPSLTEQVTPVNDVPLSSTPRSRRPLPTPPIGSK
ncbi:unnamed protein product [Cutaneotrichosporon oleaginosum]